MMLAFTIRTCRLTASGKFKKQGLVWGAGARHGEDMDGAYKPRGPQKIHLDA